MLSSSCARLHKLFSFSKVVTPTVDTHKEEQVNLISKQKPETEKKSSEKYDKFYEFSELSRMVVATRLEAKKQNIIDSPELINCMSGLFDVVSINPSKSLTEDELNIFVKEGIRIYCERMRRAELERIQQQNEGQHLLKVLQPIQSSQKKNKM